MKKKQKLWLGGGIALAAIVAILILTRFMGGTDQPAEPSGTPGTNLTTEADSAQEPDASENPDASADDEASADENTFTDENAPDKTLYMDPSMDVEDRVAGLLSQMTLREKIAQMIQPEQAAVSYEDITNYGFGSILSGGGSAPPKGNKSNHWQTHIDNMKQAALESRLSIPLLYGVDAVHGHNNVYGATIYPHNIGLGAANDPELMERIGRAVAEEVRATGIQWDFAPTLANPQNELWGRTYEGFAEDVETVASLSSAFIRGLQGDPDSDEYLSDSHVLATAKHYIGEGYTQNGTNQGNVVMDEEEFKTLLHEQLLTPYREALEAGARTVMVSYSSINGLKSHEDKYLITDVLKGELGFTGFVVSDYNGAQQVTGASYKDQMANCINAGVDMFMEPYTWLQFITTVEGLVNDGTVSMERIDDAVSRILRVKFEAGLFEEEVGGATEQALMEEFGGEKHRAIAREAVAKSLVLLKNDQINGKTAIEALSDCQHILVAGRSGDDMGSQCGGWTISWQGSMGPITAGTTIYQGLQAAAAEGVTVDYNKTGITKEEHDAVIVVIGEFPYAESDGDRNTSTLGITSQDVQVLENVREAKANNPDMPVIIVLVSGRMLPVTDFIDDADALVMAWLPGTEGAGVADVLLGDQDFTGTLKYTWVKDPADIADKFSVSKDRILFPYGYGLRKDGSFIEIAE